MTQIKEKIAMAESRIKELEDTALSFPGVVFGGNITRDGLSMLSAMAYAHWKSR